MRVLYGSPLPPGLDAPTRGELRIRIEKLFLKDDLVSAGTNSEVSSANARPYTIPIDQCAVSPLFWGEQHPSCHCIPSTPGKTRGVVSLVYSLKTYEPQFREYLEHMSNSTQKGLQLSVFVPTSYSGRHKPIPVGKSIVALDALKPSSAVSGWFTIMGDGSTMCATPEETEKNSRGGLLEVGRLKVTFSLTFFTRQPPPSLPSPTRHAAAASRTSRSASNDKGRREEKQKESDVVQDGGGHSQSLPLESHDAGVGGTTTTTTTTAGTATMPHNKLQQQQQQQQQQQKEFLNNMTGQMQKSALPNNSVASNQMAAIGEILQKGIGLRDKMAKALSHFTAFDEIDPAPNLLLSSSRPVHSMFGAAADYNPLPLLPPPTTTATGANEFLHDHCPVPPLDSSETSISSTSVEDVRSETDELVDAATSSLPVRRENHAGSACCDIPTGVRPFRLPFRSPGVSHNEDAYVEVDLSRISFSSGRATLGMEEMRVGIRLSKDVKTDEPVESYSSYVHRVPLVRGADHHIVIGFFVRSFSEDKSRMVISFYRVRSAPVANPPGELLLPAPSSAQRVLVEETLLGMCIVGLHSQSRDVILHEPITGDDPTQAYLRVNIRSGNVPSLENNALNGLSTKGVIKSKNSLGDAYEGKGDKSNMDRNIPIEANQGTINHNQQISKRYSRGQGNNVNLRTSSFSSYSSSSSSSFSSSCSSSSTSSSPCTDKLPSKTRISFTTNDNGGENENKKSNNNNNGGGGVDSRGTAAPKLSHISGQHSSNLLAHNTQNTSNVEYVANKDDKNAYLSPLKYDSSEVINAVGASGGAAGGGRESTLSANYTTALAAGQCIDKSPAKASPDRFRMHVSIRAGKELPMVTLSHEGTTLTSLVAAEDQLENGVRSAVTADGRLVLVDSKHRVFQPPTTFFVVEDLFNGADSRAMSKGIVPDWFVEAAVRGKYDRTLVMPESQSPQYDYESILSLPREAVYLRHALESKQASIREMSSHLSQDDVSAKASEKSFCLQELRLTLWHAFVDSNVVSNECNNDEESFWAKTALLGECRVDLRSLRFLKVLDGWYRINAIDRVDEVIGYVRVSVRLL